MAEPRHDSGNKMSLRSTALQQLQRIDSLSNSMGSLGDFLVSTKASILTSIVVLGIPPIIEVFLLAGGAFAYNFFLTIFSIVLVILGAVLLALNTVFVNPSQGSQFLISLRYWREFFGSSKKGIWQKIKPYRFTKKSADRDVLESIYKGQKYYTAVFKVQGNVSRTSFENDLDILHNLNTESISGLERDTVRTTINFIGIPNTKPKILNPNATPEMIERQKVLNRVINQLGGVQMLETYVILDSRSYSALRKKIRAQKTFFNQGLVVSSRLLVGKELQDVMKKLFSGEK